MIGSFKIAPTSAGTELRLHAEGEELPYTQWPLTAHPGLDIIERWILEGSAIEDTHAVLVEHQAISRLSMREAALLGLPPLTQLRAAVVGNGIFVRPDFSVSLRWLRASGQNAPNVRQIGAWLREAEGYRRLPETLYSIATSIVAHSEAGNNEAARLSAVAALRRALPQASQTGKAEAAGLIGTAVIAEASALSLDVAGVGDAIRPIPVLHGADSGGRPLLSEDQQIEFGTRQFQNWPNARNVYSLPGGVYVTIAPVLRTALEVVHRIANAGPEERRAFLREPRAAIREALGDDVDATLIDNLLIETPAWSDRVIGLGLWSKRVLPWIPLQSNDWFGTPESASKPAPPGIIVGDETIPLSRDEAERAINDLERAIAKGESNIVLEYDGQSVNVPANNSTRRALEVLLIKPNEQTQDIEALVSRRPAPALGLPACLATTLKPHQVQGLDWLQRNWRFGSPGVLLADDMGLGKTLQGLAFLAWLREAMMAGALKKRPILIVAPTGLLFNWLKEQATHLAAPALGEPTLAFGKDLARLRSVGSGLNHSALQSADWVLTTYETLRDYDKDFGGIDFAAMLLDEAQKVKTPGARMTDAAKAMRCDFRIAMTGTPVENRLADLWCIIDGVAPGHLRDLRHFSKRFEAAPDPLRMAELKATLDRDVGSRPALLLRRMKETELPGLPPHAEYVHRAEMVGIQLQAYEETLRAAGAGVQQGVLEMLQRIRAISLYPDPDTVVGDEALISRSARLRVTLEILDGIHAKGERALIFVKSLAFMARLTGLFHRRYSLAEAPMVINGSVAGASRQARVDRFQETETGFNVMILSPRAGGVGLTLTSANHVFHLTRWWNPAVEDQATARVLRIGQKRPVSIHIPIACLPSGRRAFDENLHELLTRKRQLMRDALYPAEADTGELSGMLRETLQHSSPLGNPL